MALAGTASVAIAAFLVWSEHNGLGVLVDVGLCDVLSVYGQLYPAHFASIDLEKYRKRVPGSR
jgi:hypothetical protein